MMSHQIIRMDENLEKVSENPIIQTRKLTKQFSVGGWLEPMKLHALTDATFSIARGQVIALVGESGSGKSTTARLLVRLEEPTRGEILFKGENILETEPNRVSLRYRKAVQMIFQDPFGSLNPVQTIEEHIKLPLRLHKIAKGKELNERMLDLLETVGLNPAAEIAQRYPHELSGGMRQRVAIARALAVEPELILADEPISMLDVSIRMGILNLMEDLKQERGIGFLYITHDLATARYFGDRTIVMYAGHMVESADSVELIDEPAHPYTQLLISAVPDPQVGLKTQELSARGEIISTVDPAPGCPFAARCPQVKDVCRQVMPGRTYLTDNHWINCHLYGEGENPDSV